MSASATRARDPRGLGWAVAWGVYALFCVVVLAMVWYRASPQSDATDFRDFWENAIHFRQTGVVASDLGVHNYLPFFTILMTPWGLLPLQLAAALFVALSLGMFALTVWMAEALLAPRGAPPLVPAGRGDRELKYRRGDGERTRPLSSREGGWSNRDGAGPRPALLIAAALALPYVYACGVLGNVGILLVFLVVAAWFLIERGHPWVGGVALGLATLIKLLPAVLVGVLLLRRSWRAAGGAALTCLVLGVGWPLLALGPGVAWREHVAFYERAIRGHSAATTILVDRPIKANFSNNAVPIVLRRLLTPVNAGKHDQELLVNVADLPRVGVLATYFALIGAIVTLSVLPPLWKRRKGGAARVPHEDDGPEAARWQYASWCCLMLLASPLVWTHYLPLVYWPLAMLADRADRVARERGRPCRWSTAALIAWLIATLLLVSPAARAAGALTAGVFVLWLACTALAWQAGRTRSPRMAG